jgi:16S rRNA (adenine1518-N6/adenine1519-N6)-dimethyltransferase
MDELPLSAGDVVIEIGPGRGAMTALLAPRVRKVAAIELDPALVEKLREDFPDEARLRIIHADILSVDLAALCREEGVAQAFVFGNLPYYITSPILHHLFAHRHCIRAMGLLMQREVADRLVAQPGSRDYGYLTVATQLFSQPHIALAVPPGAFSPPPKVRSALVSFSMQARFAAWPQATCDDFLEFVKRCFAQKRKNLLNNLAGAYPRPAIEQACAQAGKSPALRAEQLSLEELAAIFADLGHER